ncbi:MAG TPA: hypothetical protein VJJ78_02240 [Candidatus Saccharimonadales bacterium]|nr:hypothetical protein [Candidatus Saccharimonadales bacterium]
MSAIHNLETQQTSHQDVRLRLQMGEKVVRHLYAVPDPEPDSPPLTDANLVGLADRISFRQRVADSAPWQAIQFGTMAIFLTALNSNRVTGATLGAFLERAPHTGYSVAGVLGAVSGIGAGVSYGVEIFKESTSRKIAA